MKSKKLILRSMEVMLGLSKIEDIVDYDIRFIIKENITDIEEQNRDLFKMIKSSSYEMKLAFMKFFENATNLAEAEHGPHFTPKNFQDALIKIMNGNPLNMIALAKTNEIIKNW